MMGTKLDAMHAVCFAFGLGLGMGMMYLADPQSGSRRRSMIRDRAGEWAHDAGDFVTTTASDWGHRAQNMAHDMRHAVMG